MRKQVDTWADDATVRAELSLKPGDGHTYTLVVYEAHYEASKYGEARSELRVILEKDGDRRSDYTVQEPQGKRFLSKRYRFVEEQAAEVDGLTFALAHYTESFDYDDPDQSIERRIAVVVRKGEDESWPEETGAGYIREWNYVPPPKPPTPPIVWPDNPEPEDALYCDDCGIYVEPDSGVPIYECSRCGQATAERRCEQCNIFTAKLSDNGCPECEAAELEEAQAIRDADGHLHSLDERDRH